MGKNDIEKQIKEVIEQLLEKNSDMMNDKIQELNKTIIDLKDRLNHQNESIVNKQIIYNEIVKALSADVIDRSNRVLER